MSGFTYSVETIRAQDRDVYRLVVWDNTDQIWDVWEGLDKHLLVSRCQKLYQAKRRGPKLTLLQGGLTESPRTGSGPLP